MGERPTIAFRANSEEQKEKWQTAVDESEEYDSLSHLIRKAVERELATGTDRPCGTAMGDDSERLGEIQTTLQQLGNEMKELKDGLRALEEAADIGSTVSDDIVADVYRALGQAEQRPNEIADGADVSEEAAKRALMKLAEDMEGVSLTMTDDGETAYYRTE